MYAAESLALRVSIVLGMVAAVVTILYFTPLPDYHIKSCDRPCHDYDWPMICRYQLILETYKTLDSSCQDCIANATLCDQTCFTSDGNLRNIFTVNRQLPGPPIHVCKNDILVVDVVNKVPAQSLAIHWRGQPHLDTPFMDGVPMISQCPVTSYTTFQYKFRASAAGTHVYHAHSGSEMAAGFFGALVVREPNRIEPQKKFYDVDDRKHLVVITESTNTSFSDERDRPNSILINGKFQEGNTSAVFEVRKGKRYRFRVAYSGGVSGCPVSLEIDQHLLKVIAVDGHPTVAYEASSIVLGKGERVDFVLKAKRPNPDYFLHVHSVCNKDLWSRAVVKYNERDATKHELVRDDQIENGEGDSKRTFDSGVCTSPIGHICIGDIRSVKKMPKILRTEHVDKRFYLLFDYKMATYQSKEVSSNPRKLYRMNNITFTFPPSPLETQLHDVPDQLLCASAELPQKCSNQEICECVHVEEIPLGATVEIILSDQGGDSNENVFHLHGYSFYVVASSKFDEPLRLDRLKTMDERGQLFKRNLLNPVLKDTIRIPKYGVVVLRFVADNPGFWMLRDEISKSWTRGMDTVFKVGDIIDFAPPPSNFPSCGSWVGPEFFLA